MSVREMLHRLARDEHEVHILGAGIFDSPAGLAGLGSLADRLNGNAGTITSINDEALRHDLVVTADTSREAMTSAEQDAWFHTFLRKLDDFQPDLVYFYGGQVLELLLTAESRRREIPCAAYLVNGNYRNSRWCHDVSLILTNSKATANHYEQKWGIRLSTTGTFIEPADVISSHREPRRILAINPSLAKGGAIIAQIAILMEKMRPDITFEVVESRGNWKQILRQVSGRSGHPRDSLDNVVVTPNTDDMRPVYGRARLLLALSLWWESFPRVVIEALHNGIPTVISTSGGLPEAAGTTAFTVRFPDECHHPPYNRLPPTEALQPLIAHIVRCHDDQPYYARLSELARKQSHIHQPERSYARLRAALTPLLSKRAGDHSAPR